MSLSIGIVGLPNVGKSTLFNALLKKQVALAANYPFATIDPNVGVAEVPDERLAVLAPIVHTQVIKPALVEFVDIAGLVKGASQGEGLGNKFLAHIRETNAICHVVRLFSDEKILREGSISPLADLETIRTELALADLETVSKQQPPKGKVDALAQARWQVIEIINKQLQAGKPVSQLLPSSHANISEEIFSQVSKELCLLTAKPELIALNVDETQLVDSIALADEWAPKLGVKPQQVVVISAQIESELALLSKEEQQAYLQELGLAASGLDRLAKVAYQTLGLQSFLTAGELEVRAWTIRAGTTAAAAAGVIHTDFTKKFIKALIVDYVDFISLGSMAIAREKGKLRQEGRDYVMHPNDIVEFMIGK